MPEDVSSTRIDEATESLNTKKFYLLLLFVSIVGIIGSLMMVLFFFLEDLLTGLIWGDIPVASLTPVFNPWILVIGIAGGLCVGLIRYYFHGQIAIMAEDLNEFNEKGRFGLKQGIELFIRGLASLVCGAPLASPYGLYRSVAGNLHRRESPDAFLWSPRPLLPSADSSVHSLPLHSGEPSSSLR